MISPMMLMQPNFGDEPLSGGGLVPMNLPQANLKRGMFANGNLQDALMAAAAGFLSRRSPQVSNNLFDNIQRKQIMAQQEAQYQRHRDDSFSDFQRQYDYKLAHPDTPNNDTVADYNFWKGVLSPEQFQQYIQNKINPPMMQYVPGVGLVQTRGGQGGAPAPTAPVGKLTPINGGPTPTASGNFPY